MSGIVAILATGGRALGSRELDALRAGIQTYSKNQVNQWKDSFTALISATGSVGRIGRESSLALDPSLDLACVLEGQLHNSAELRANLGGVANDLTASEIVLKAYALWGETFVRRLRGEFALMVWDAHAKRLICARDPIGIKALYLCQEGDSFLITSNLEFLLRTYGRIRTINAKAIAAYISGDPLTTTTFYDGVDKLPAGTTLVVSAKDGARRTFKHWSVSDFKAIHYNRSDDYADHFRDIFVDAIRCRLSGPGHSGLLLSGGLDSSSIACTASQIISNDPSHPADLLTFSVISDHRKPDSDGDIFDETPYINEVVTSCGIDPRFFRYEDFLGTDDFAKPTKYVLPIPPGMGVFKKIFRSANEAGVTKMLSGIGGDEILGSNSNVYLLRYADLLSSGNARELVDDLKHAHDYYPWSQVFGLLWKYGCWPLFRSLFDGWSTAAHRDLKALSVSQRKTYFELSSGELVGYGIEAFDVLEREAGIEARYPYLDTRVVEFCLMVPSSELSRHYQTKLLLRRSMAGILPEKVRLRTGKASSTSFLHTWLSEEIRPEVENLLKTPTLSRGVDWDLIRRLYAEYCRGNMGHSRRITKAIGLELWHRAKSNTEV